MEAVAKRVGPRSGEIWCGVHFLIFSVYDHPVFWRSLRFCLKSCKIQTFYYHFKDIYDLVEWSCLEDAKRALDEKKTYETWQQGFLQIFEAVQDNKPFILNVYRCVHREQVEKYLRPLVDRLLLDVINEEVGEMKVRDEDKQFIAQIYSYIFIGLMLDWIKDDMREDPQQIVDRLARLIKGSVSAALSRFQF